MNPGCIRFLNDPFRAVYVDPKGDSVKEEERLFKVLHSKEPAAVVAEKLQRIKNDPLLYTDDPDEATVNLARALVS